MLNTHENYEQFFYKCKKIKYFLHYLPQNDGKVNFIQLILAYIPFIKHFPLISIIKSTNNFFY